MGTAYQVWKAGPVVALLSWLDFCLRHDLDFEGTIIEHIRDSNKSFDGIGDEFVVTNHQVYQKLFSLRRAEGTLGREVIKPAELRKQGSTCLRLLSEEVQNGTKIASSSYSAAYADSLLLRASARIANEDHDLSVMEKTTVPPSNKSLELHRRQADTGRSMRSPAIIAGPSDEHQELAGNTSTSRKVDIRTSQSEQECRNVGRSKPAVAPATGRAEDQKHGSAIRQKNAEIARIRAEWQQEAEELRHIGAQLKDKVLELEVKNENLNEARQERERAGKDPLESKLYQNNQDIWALKRRIGNQERLACFAQRDVQQPIPISTKLIDEVMENIGSEMEAVMLGHIMNKSMVMPSIIPGSDLASLINSCCMDGTATRLAENGLRRCIIRYGPSLTVKTLLVVALHDWVFATDFPNFTPGDLRLLRAYRNAVIGHDGWNRLHNLELAAYDTLISDARFQETLIPARAGDLAIRFSEALASLFPRSANESPELHSKSWGQIPLTYEDRIFHIGEIFEVALRFKAFTMTSDEKYEFVVVPPGSLTAGQYQAGNEQDGLEQADVEATNDHDASYVLATLHVMPLEASIPRDPMADALVNSKNFASTSGEERALRTKYQKSIHVPLSEIHLRDGTSPVGTGNANAGAYSKTGDLDQISETNGNISITSDSKGSEPPLTCDTCARAFVYKGSLAKHEKQKACIKCLDCTQYFVSQTDLTRHQRNLHANLSSGAAIERTNKRVGAASQEVTETTSRKRRRSSKISSEEEQNLFDETAGRPNPRGPGQFPCKKCKRVYTWKQNLITHQKTNPSCKKPSQNHLSNRPQGHKTPESDHSSLTPQITGSSNPQQPTRSFSKNTARASELNGLHNVFDWQKSTPRPQDEETIKGGDRRRRSLNRPSAPIIYQIDSKSDAGMLDATAHLTAILDRKPNTAKGSTPDILPADLEHASPLAHYSSVYDHQERGLQMFSLPENPLKRVEPRPTLRSSSSMSARGKESLSRPSRPRFRKEGSLLPEMQETPSPSSKIKGSPDWRQ